LTPFVNQSGQQIINQPGQVIYNQQPAQSVPGTYNGQQPLPTPTLRPTGSTSITFFTAGFVIALIVIGGLMFAAL
jgi:hypothetical protein